MNRHGITLLVLLLAGCSHDEGTEVLPADVEIAPIGLLRAARLIARYGASTR